MQPARGFAVVKVPSHSREISEMAKFHERSIIAKSDYYKQIIRFPRFQKPCDGKNVDGISPDDRNELKIQKRKAKYENFI